MSEDEIMAEIWPDGRIPGTSFSDTRTDVVPLMRKIWKWYNGMPNEYKLACVALWEIMSHGRQFPVKNFGDHIFKKLHCDVLLAEDLDSDVRTLCGLYAGLFMCPA